MDNYNVKIDNLIYDLKEYFKEAKDNNYMDIVVNYDLTKMLESFVDKIYHDARDEASIEIKRIVEDFSDSLDNFLDEIRDYE